MTILFRGCGTINYKDAFGHAQLQSIQEDKSAHYQRRT